MEVGGRFVAGFVDVHSANGTKLQATLNPKKSANNKNNRNEQ